MAASYLDVALQSYPPWTVFPRPLNVCLRAKRANTRLRICPILLSRFLCVAS